MGVVWAGLGLGLFLFGAKAGIFYLLTHYKDPKTGDLKDRIWPKWILFGKPMPLWARIHESTFLLVCVDTASGYIGMHIFAAFNGGIIAMVGMATYSIVCAITIGYQFISHSISKRLSPKFKTKHHKKKNYPWLKESYT